MQKALEIQSRYQRVDDDQEEEKEEAQGLRLAAAAATADANQVMQTMKGVMIPTLEGS